MASEPASAQDVDIDDEDNALVVDTDTSAASSSAGAAPQIKFNMKLYDSWPDALAKFTKFHDHKGNGWEKLEAVVAHHVLLQPAGTGGRGPV